MNKEPTKLDDQQPALPREIFRSFDCNDGSLTQLELGSLRSLGLKPCPDQLETLSQKANKNSGGLVEFSEFCLPGGARAASGEVVVHGGATLATVQNV